MSSTYAPIRIALIVLGLIALTMPFASSAGLKAGFSERDITPEVPDTWVDVDDNAQFDPEVDTWVDGNGNDKFDPVWMAGFQNNRPAQGVELPLKAIAMVLDDGKHRIGIVAADTIGLMRSFAQDLRANVPDELALNYVMVHATHNHEGPDTQGLWGEGALSSGINDDYMRFLRDEMISALAEAVTALEPATLHMAEFPNPPQTPVRDARKPIVVDDAVRVLALRSLEGALLGTVVNFGIHVELAWDRNLLLTSDVAGYLRDGISGGITYDGAIKKPGIGGTTLWLTGNIGGLMTSAPGEWVEDPFSGERITDAGHGKARAFGYGLASAVIDQWNEQLFTEETNPSIEIVSREVEFGITNWMLALATITGVVDSSPSFHLSRPFIRYTSEVAWLKLGQATITGIPGELYPEIAVGGIENPHGADYALDPVEVPPLREAMSGEVNLMVNLANDAIGYIIPKSEWDNEAPWIYGATEETYGEIVSLGEETGPTLHRQLLNLFQHNHAHSHRTKRASEQPEEEKSE